MSTIHFLNVNDGDCSWIKHESGRVTVIDICAGNEEDTNEECLYEALFGNYHQKDHPVNPIEYLNKYEIKSIFRFILTHPDMDHMDGIKKLFETFSVGNFWDTENNKTMNKKGDWGRYKKEDWDFYQEIRKSEESPKVLHNYSGAKGAFFNQNEDGSSGGDELYILAPTKDLVSGANVSKKYNDCSYVLLYKTHGRKIIFAGDSEKNTWDYILENYKDSVTDVDILLAPHHGRKTGGNQDYLDILRPKFTLFGNAESKNLDYSSWNNRKLEHITNNQAGCVIMNIDGDDEINVYITCEKFAKNINPYSFFEKEFDAWYIKTI